MKLKEGDKVSFPFAGTIHEGVFVGEGTTGRDSSSKKILKCKTEDGTIYPVDVHKVSKILNEEDY